MKHLKLFESFCSILESENTNLEMKAIFKNLIREMRDEKGMNLKVKFEYKKFDSPSGMQKFRPSENWLDQKGHDAYLVMDDGDKDWSSKLCVTFNHNIDRSASTTYVENVKKFIDGLASDPNKNLQVELETETGVNMFGETYLLVKPRSTKNKTEAQYMQKANSFMGLKRTVPSAGISYLVGSGYEYLNDNMDKTKEFELIKVDDNKKIVELSRGYGLNIEESPKKEKLIKVAKKFAEKNGYEYVSWLS